MAAQSPFSMERVNKNKHLGLLISAFIGSFHHLIHKTSPLELFARDPMFGGDCLLTEVTIPFEDRPLIRVLQVTGGIKRAKLGVKNSPNHKNCKIGINGTKIAKLWVKICVSSLK